jgi:hypothetical protein
MAGQYLEQIAALEMAREATQPTRPADPTILTDAKTVLRLADAPNSRPPPPLALSERTHRLGLNH